MKRQCPQTPSQVSCDSIVPFDPSDSTGYTGWYPKNDPYNWDSMHPDPVEILAKEPSELNKPRTAATSAAGSSSVKLAVRVKESTFVNTGKPLTEYLVVARKGTKVLPSWTAKTNAKGTATEAGVKIPAGARLSVVELA